MKVFDGSEFEWHKVKKLWADLKDARIIIMRPYIPIQVEEFSIRSPKTNLIIDMTSPSESKPQMFSDGVMKILVEDFDWMKQDRITYWINHLSAAPHTILVVQKEKI